MDDNYQARVYPFEEARSVAVEFAVKLILEEVAEQWVSLGESLCRTYLDMLRENVPDGLDQRMGDLRQQLEMGFIDRFPFREELGEDLRDVAHAVQRLLDRDLRPMDIEDIEDIALITEGGADLIGEANNYHGGRVVQLRAQEVVQGELGDDDAELLYYLIKDVTMLSDIKIEFEKIGHQLTLDVRALGRDFP